MSEYTTLAIISLIIFITHLQEGITGFGCTALALPFVLLLVELDVAVKALCMMAWVLAFWLVIVARKDIVWKEYWHIVIPMAAGMVIGVVMHDKLPQYWLKWILAIFMLGVGTRGIMLKQSVGDEKTGMSRTSRLLYSFFLPASGVMQGAFSSGGPLLVIYASKALPRKSIFRVTLCMVWVTINGLLIGQWAIRGLISTDSLKIAAVGIPFSLVGGMIGNWAHHRVNEFAFRRIVYGVLIIAGVMLAGPLIPKLTAMLGGSAQ